MCQTCRHYEPSAVWKRGWCRNPRLYGPRESHMVDEESLDCSRGLGSFWEPADPDRAARADAASIRMGPAPVLGAATAAIAAAGPAASEDHPGDPGSRSRPEPDRAVPSPEEERPVSYQPEERYWTDYLRIALPVLGLLLLIGLLWYWASALIGGPGSEPPPTAQAIAITPVNEATPPPVPTATTAAVVPTPGPPVATQPAAAPTTAAAAVATQPAAAPTTAPVATEPPAVEPTAPAAAVDPANPCAGLPVYAVGDALVTTDEVNLREGASTDTPILATLPAGTPLTVAGDFTEAGQCDWWPITVVSTGQAGFIREDFVQLAAS